MEGFAASGNGSLVPIGPTFLQVTTINSGPTINYNHLKALQSNQKQTKTEDTRSIWKKRPHQVSFSLF